MSSKRFLLLTITESWRKLVAFFLSARGYAALEPQLLGWSSTLRLKAI